jgi:hypothetical protein
MTATKTRPNRNPVLAVMRDDFGSDDWGTAISWAFAVAEVSTLEGIDVAPELEYRPSIIGPTLDGYPDTYLYDMYQAGEVSEDDLREAGTLLARYLDWLRAAGRDY